MTQPNAAIAAREMYNSSYVESDLINSYSWDTAIVFIQKYSGNSNYANQNGKSINSSKQNTGKAGDKICNVHDMAANCYEWSTECCTNDNTGNTCVSRGGHYLNTSYYTSVRSGTTTSYSGGTNSFRPLLYVK